MRCAWCEVEVRGGHLVADVKGPYLVACSVRCAEAFPRDCPGGPSVEAWLWRAPGRTLRLVTDDDDTARVLVIACDSCGDMLTHRLNESPSGTWRRFRIVGLAGTLHACGAEHEAAVRRKYARPEED